jgi:hypothetical protein
MSVMKSLASGLVGSATLTAIHQGAKRYIDHAPHVDAIGRRAIAKGITRLGGTPPEGDRLQNMALAGDLASNAAYYALVNVGHPRYRLLRGAALGLIGGLGAVVLPKPLGLGKQPGQRTPRTQLLTIAWYTLGGLAAALAAEALSDDDDNA